eukprot:403346796
MYKQIMFNQAKVFRKKEELKGKIWYLIEKILELLIVFAESGFFHKIAFDQSQTDLIKHLAKRENSTSIGNILTLLEKYEQQLPKLNMNRQNGWRNLLEKGLIVYFKENSAIDDTQYHLTKALITEVQQEQALVLNYQDQSGTERTKLIGRWSSLLFFPQFDNEIIQHWRLNLKIGDQLLVCKGNFTDKKTWSWVACTIVDVAHDSEQETTES